MKLTKLALLGRRGGKLVWCLSLGIACSAFPVLPQVANAGHDQGKGAGHQGDQNPIGAEETSTDQDELIRLIEGEVTEETPSEPGRDSPTKPAKSAENPESERSQLLDSPTTGSDALSSDVRQQYQSSTQANQSLSPVDNLRVGFLVAAESFVESLWIALALGALIAWLTISGITGKLTRQNTP